MNVPLPPLVPLPVDDRGRSEIAVLSTRQELVEYLGGLLVEAGGDKPEPRAVTIDDWAVFRSECRAAKLPVAHVEWIESVPFEDVRSEAIRQLDEGYGVGKAAVRDDATWGLRAVAGEYLVQEADPAVAGEGRDWLRRLLFRRRRSAIMLQDAHTADIARLMQEPPLGWDAHPGLGQSDRGRADRGNRARDNRGKQPSSEPVPGNANGTSGARLRQ